MKKAVRALVYLAAAVSAWTGLGVGLQQDTTIGTVLLASGLALASLNTLWIVKENKDGNGKREPDEDQQE